jgi:hypothetical protein
MKFILERYSLEKYMPCNLLLFHTLYVIEKSLGTSMASKHGRTALMS